MPRTPEKILEERKEEEEAYADKYILDATEYWKQGVYNMIAGLISPPSAGLHVNFCSGPCFLERAMRRRYPDIALASIDMNKPMIERAASMLSEEDITFRKHLISRINFSGTLTTADGDPLSWRTYDFSSLDKSNFLMPGGPIEIIQADVCDSVVLDEILQGRKLDSSSYTFLGNSKSYLEELTVDCSKLREDKLLLQRKLEETWIKVEAALNGQITSHTDSGGKLIIGVRVDDKDFIIERLREYVHYWNPGKIIQTGASVQQNSHFVPIVLQEFIRNERPFPKA